MPNSRKIVIATGNPGKVREIGAVLADLSVEIVSLKELPPLAEPVEDGDSFAANAEIKARYYAQQTGMWCLADDSGLVVDALGGAPGIHSARYAANECDAEAGRDAIDEANNAKLLRELQIIPDECRTARFVCYLALADANGVLLETSGAIEGRIARQACGEGGFGYDPLFHVPHLGCTTAELPAEQKNAISHRGQAVRTFHRMLQDMLAAMP